MPEEPFDPKKYPDCVYCYHMAHHVNRAKFNDDGLCPVGISFVCFGPRKSRENCDCTPCGCGECLAKMSKEEREVAVGFYERFKK